MLHPLQCKNNFYGDPYKLHQIHLHVIQEKKPEKASELDIYTYMTVCVHVWVYETMNDKCLHIREKTLRRNVQ